MSKDNLQRVYEEAQSVNAGDVMTRHVVTVGEDEPVETAVRKMCEENFHRLPVMRDGIPVGMVARHDLLRVMLRAGTSGPEQAQG